MGGGGVKFPGQHTDARSRRRMLRPLQANAKTTRGCEQDRSLLLSRGQEVGNRIFPIINVATRRVEGRQEMLQPGVASAA